MVFMDFDQKLMAEQGHGNYQPLQVDPSNLPLFFIAYLGMPSDSGKIHSNVRQRFDEGEYEVRFNLFLHTNNVRSHFHQIGH